MAKRSFSANRNVKRGQRVSTQLPCAVAGGAAQTWKEQWRFTTTPLTSWPIMTVRRWR